jgi:GDP-4-dehydro-6-deoxy-D-mannose reductase
MSAAKAHTGHSTAADKKLLITGHSGFVGTTLLREQQQLAGARAWQLLTLPLELDINDESGLQRALEQSRPDYILHLAAQSFVPASFEDPRLTLQVNLLGTLSLLQAATRAGFKGRLLYVSSSDVYGIVPPGEMPISEDRCPAPRNPYAVSKAAAELLCQQWALAGQFEVVIARPFNHVGPGQDSRFVLSGFAREIALRLCGQASGAIVTGDVDVSRDFTDVLDVLEAYVALLTKGVSARTYNICSGHGLHIGETLAAMLVRAGVDAGIQPDPARFRPNEQKRVVGSSARLLADTDWAPRRPLEHTLASMVADWKGKIRL